ncbi:FxsA family membrane protein [Streptomyces sp. NPDC055078]
MTTGAMPPTAPGSQRSRARRLIPLAVAAWLVLEIWLLIAVGNAAGGLTVFALLVVGAVVGGTVVKRAGRRAFQNLSETLQQQQSGRPPSTDNGSSGNGFLMLGGLLIMLPGLISDVAGLVLLLPPVRTRLARYAERSLERRMREAGPGSLGDAFQQARMRRPDGKVVQGEVIRPDAAGPESHPDAPRPPQPPLTS